MFLIDSDKLNAAVVICSSTVVLGSLNLFVSDHLNVSTVITLLVLGAYTDEHL